MFKCWNCGDTFRTPDEKSWTESYGEHFTQQVCPYCGSDDTEEGYACVSCEDDFVEEYGDLCEACKAEFSEEMFLFRVNVTKSMHISNEKFEELVTEWFEKNWR